MSWGLCHFSFVPSEALKTMAAKVAALAAAAAAAAAAGALAAPVPLHRRVPLADAVQKRWPSGPSPRRGREIAVGQRGG